MKRFISAVAVVLGLSLAFGSTALVVEKAHAASNGQGGSGSSNGAGGAGGAGNSGSAGGPAGQGQGGGGSNGGVGGAPGNAGGNNGGGNDGGGNNGGGGTGGGSTGGGVSTAGGGSTGGSSTGGASAAGASAGVSGGEGAHGTEAGYPHLSATTREHRDIVARDLRACDNNLIWHDTKVDGKGVVTFMYGTFPEYEVPSFVACMKAKGYTLSSPSRADLTNFGTRPDSAAKATVQQTDEIIAAEKAKNETVKK